MTEPRNLIAEAAAANQRRASDPAATVWVEASAGSGKTKVLTDRVLRLLLAGTDPGRILCLTFTKAAAAEMANRLFQRLSKWAAQPESELAGELVALQGFVPTATQIRRARRLFAGVLDAPDGLRIETLHGFAQSLLRRFPVEAGVSPTFDIIDERREAEILRRARERVFRDAAPGSDLDRAIAFITDTVSDASFPGLIAAINGARVKIGRAIRAWGGRVQLVDGITAHFDLPPGADAAQILRSACRDAACDVPGLKALARALADCGGKTDGKRAAAMLPWLYADEADRPALWEEYLGGFLGKTGEPYSTKTYPCKAALALLADGPEILSAEQDRLVAVCEKLAAARLRDATGHLLTLAEAVFAIYEREKARGGWLDYDDLIQKARDLLDSAEARPWVLYKLDGGLDHILVDEAQDTAPDQWAVVDALTAEFFAGSGARGDVVRTVFAVGDIKQSIYRFQGADPAMFTGQRDKMFAAAAEADLKFARVPLGISFRSVQAVLDVVDSTFDQPDAGDGVRLADVPPVEQRHLAARDGEPGLVEVWPRVPRPEAAPVAPWSPPVERLRVDSAATVCAHLVADRIARMVGKGGAPEILAAKGRPIRAGDIMVLVRKRDAFQTDLIRALKQKGVAVAGADRLDLAGHMAVQDCLAAAEAALLPRDDLTLAAVLKGPFVGWSEEELFALCHGRGDGVGVWKALNAKAHGGDPRAATALGAVKAWGVAARSLRPFGFFTRLLDAEGGRAILRARMGGEVDDPLDELLDLAQGFERDHPGSVQSFLRWFATGAVEIKRDLEQGAQDQVRILTVHGAKGLQAPVVFLPQTTGGGSRLPELEWANAEGKPLPIWRVPGAGTCDGLTFARDARETEDAREVRRLLYVAMTRAEDRLYVCGWDGGRTAPTGTWHDLVRAGVAGLTQPVADDLLSAAFGASASLWRWQGKGGVAAKLAPSKAVASAVRAPLPAWAARPAPDEPMPGRPLMPSRPDVADPPMLSPLAANPERFRRGNLVHRMLQSLPEVAPEARAATARRYLDVAAADWPEAARAALVAEALAVLDLLDLRPLFARDSRAEVPIAGMVGGAAAPRLLAGQIDRLAFDGDTILIADYKTNRPPPASAADVAPAYRAQMAAYRGALGAMFPEKRVRTFLIWTDGPSVMELTASD
jgi:ATP-dependent helicase/nuclease subunit A